MSPKPKDERQSSPTPAETKGSQPPAKCKPEPPQEPECGEAVQQTLDDALADSFPASDPVSIVTSQHEEAWDDKR